VLAYRDQIWATATSALRAHPAFGIGMDNFSRLDAPRVRGWAEARGEPFDEKTFFFAPHAHSLYFNTLAERGLAGSAVLLAVLVAWIASLARGFPGARAGDAEWAAWGAALSGWLVTMLVGFANTTLHHEHALLAVLLLGLWLGLRARLRA
jgi:O-antigen ligase